MENNCFFNNFLFVCFLTSGGVWWRDEDQSKTAKCGLTTHTDELCKKMAQATTTFIPELLVCRTMTEKEREMCFTVPVLTT